MFDNFFWWATLLIKLILSAVLFWLCIVIVAPILIYIWLTYSWRIKRYFRRRR